MMFFLIHDHMIYLSDKVAEIVYENDPEKRKFLYEEYKDLEEIHRLYMSQLEDGRQEFSWYYVFNKRELSLHNLGHFKLELLRSGITEEEWQKEVEKTYKSIGEEKVKQYLKEYEEYVKKHYGS